MPVAVWVEGVRVAFGAVQALRGVDLQAETGAVVGVIGVNGAGKTTLLRVLQGAVVPDTGRAEIFGRDVRRLGPRERGALGAQLDRGGLPPTARAREVLVFLRRLYGRGHEPDALLEELGLGGAAGRLVRDLSTGQHRRLAVAAALIGRPRLVFLDEPSLGLDPIGKRALWESLRRAACAGATILLTTNAMDEAEALCDEVAVLRDGAVVARGAPAALLDRFGALHRIELETAVDAVAAAALARLDAVVEVRRDGRRTLLLSRDAVATIRALVARAARRPPRFRWVAPRLEDVVHRVQGGEG